MQSCSRALALPIDLMFNLDIFNFLTLVNFTTLYLSHHHPQCQLRLMYHLHHHCHSSGHFVWQQSSLLSQISFSIHSNTQLAYRSNPSLTYIVLLLGHASLQLPKLLLGLHRLLSHVLISLKNFTTTH